MNAIAMRAAFTAAALAAAVGPVAAAPPAGAVTVANNTGVTVRIDGDYYVDADGKRVDLGGFWMFAPGEDTRLARNGRDLVGSEFHFRITTPDGQSRGWSQKNLAGGALGTNLNAATLAEHQKLVAAGAAGKAAGVGVLTVRVPPGATVSIGDWKATVAGGAALITTPTDLKAGTAEASTVRVEHRVGGETFNEEGTFHLEPGAPLEWDCRDVAAPDKMARTARYVFACREASRREFEKAGKDPTPAAEAAAMEAVARRFDGQPTRGVDEDAVKQNQACSAGFLRVARAVKAGTAGKADIDKLSEELTETAKRTRALLEARYGDPYQKALANGGRVPGGTVTTFRPPADVVPPPPADDRADRRRRLDADLASVAASIRTAEAELTTLNNKVAVANLAVLAAQAAYDRAETNGGAILAGLALATAVRARDELVADRNSLEADLRVYRDRRNKLTTERRSLGD